MSSSVQWNGATMGLPVFSSTRGAAGTTGATAAGGSSCAPRTSHAIRSNTSFRMALNGYQTIALLFQTNSMSRRNIIRCSRHLPLKSPLRRRAHSPHITKMRPLPQTSGGYLSNKPPKRTAPRAGALTPYHQNAPATPNLGWLFVEQTLKEHRAEVALGGIGQHRHNRLAGEFRQFAQPHRHRRRRTAGDAAQNALLFG